jgi:hypothetical protein
LTIISNAYISNFSPWHLIFDDRMKEKVFFSCLRAENTSTFTKSEKHKSFLHFFLSLSIFLSVSQCLFYNHLNKMRSNPLFFLLNSLFLFFFLVSEFSNRYATSVFELPQMKSTFYSMRKNKTKNCTYREIKSSSRST